MSLTNQVFKLKPYQVIEACHIMLDASIAREMGGNWREIFRQAKHRHKAGRLHRIYALLEKAKDEDIDRMAESLIMPLPGHICPDMPSIEQQAKPCHAP